MSKIFPGGTWHLTPLEAELYLWFGIHCFNNQSPLFYPGPASVHVNVPVQADYQAILCQARKQWSFSIFLFLQSLEDNDFLIFSSRQMILKFS